MLYTTVGYELPLPLLPLPPSPPPPIAPPSFLSSIPLLLLPSSPPLPLLPLPLSPPLPPSPPSPVVPPSFLSFPSHCSPFLPLPLLPLRPLPLPLLPLPLLHLPLLPLPLLSLPLLPLPPSPPPPVAPPSSHLPLFSSFFLFLSTSCLLVALGWEGRHAKHAESSRTQLHDTDHLPPLRGHLSTRELRPPLLCWHPLQSRCPVQGRARTPTWSHGRICHAQSICFFSELPWKAGAHNH